MGCRSFISIILSGYLFVECGVFAQNFEIFGQRGDRVDRLPVTGVVRKGYVHVEAVLPFAADNGHRLDFGEVDVVERKDGQYFGEASLGMRQAEYERCLVGAGGTRVAVGVVAVGQQQEAREVAFLCLFGCREESLSSSFTGFARFPKDCHKETFAPGTVGHEAIGGQIANECRRYVPSWVDIDCERYGPELFSEETDHLLVFFGLQPKLGPIETWGLHLERKQIVVDTARFSAQCATFAADHSVMAAGSLRNIPSPEQGTSAAMMSKYSSSAPNAEASLRVTMQ